MSGGGALFGFSQNQVALLVVLGLLPFLMIALTSFIKFAVVISLLRNALGTHSTVSRVQGGRLKAKREIRIASLFKEAPEPFLKMIVVHELAHLKERDHDKPFYALCAHMAPDYHQLEFDARLWLTARELDAPSAG